MALFRVALNYNKTKRGFLTTTRSQLRLGLVEGSRGPTQIHIRGLCHWAGEKAPDVDFYLSSGGCKLRQTRPWLGLVDLSRIPSGTFFREVHPGSEMATSLSGVIRFCEIAGLIVTYHE